MVRLINSLRILPRWIIMLIDLAMVVLASNLAYLLRFNFDTAQVINHDFILGTLAFIASWFCASLITRSYAGIIRYTGLQDGVRLLFATLLSISFVVIINIVNNYYVGNNFIPYSVILISFFTSYLFLFIYRLAVKYTFSHYGTVLGKKENVLIFGAGQSGLITKQVIDSDKNTSQRVVGFLEDNEQKTGKSLDGTHIYNASKGFEEIIKELSIKEIIISVRHLPLNRKNEIVDVCLKHNIKVSTVPPIEKWVKGELSLKQIKEIRIEDLLGRESIELNNEFLNKEFVNESILVTGAAGSIGSEIVRQLLMYGPKTLILLDQAESSLYEIENEVLKLNKFRIRVITVLADIRNNDALEKIFELHNPSIVFHAAAYKHVPMMENNPSEAVVCNIFGTRNLADLSVKYQVEKFVMISTDKAVNPTNVMGCSKRIAEIYVQSLNNKIKHSDTSSTRFITTRFGNVLGSNGSVIPYFKKQISLGGPVTVTHPDITRYFMTIPEACQLVLEAGRMGEGGEIMIFDMGESIKIVDLAKKMIRLSGMEVGKDIEIIYSGLREGEKLYEELLNQSENSISTHHEKIMIAKVEEKPFEEVQKDIALLELKIHEKNELELVAQMKNIVPEFISNSSRFEMLDK